MATYRYLEKEKLNHTKSVADLELGIFKNKIPTFQNATLQGLSDPDPFWISIQHLFKTIFEIFQNSLQLLALQDKT